MSESKDATDHLLKQIIACVRDRGTVVRSTTPRNRLKIAIVAAPSDEGGALKWFVSALFQGKEKEWEAMAFPKDTVLSLAEFLVEKSASDESTWESDTYCIQWLKTRCAYVLVDGCKVTDGYRVQNLSVTDNQPVGTSATDV